MRSRALSQTPAPSISQVLQAPDKTERNGRLTCAWLVPGFWYSVSSWIICCTPDSCGLQVLILGAESHRGESTQRSHSCLLLESSLPGDQLVQHQKVPPIYARQGAGGPGCHSSTHLGSAKARAWQSRDPLTKSFQPSCLAFADTETLLKQATLDDGLKTVLLLDDQDQSFTANAKEFVCQYVRGNTEVLSRGVQRAEPAISKGQ